MSAYRLVETGSRRTRYRVFDATDAWVGSVVFHARLGHWFYVDRADGHHGAPVHDTADEAALALLARGPLPRDRAG